MLSLMEVFLPGPLLHHAVEAVAVAGEGRQLVEAAPGEDLGVPGDQEVSARPQGLVTIISLASRQPPQVVTAGPLLVFPLRGEGVAVIAVIVVVSVSLLVIRLTELVLVATGGPGILTLVVTMLILTMLMVIVITVV